jgi:IclR family transcriptional regulator, acetate operon repressor
MSRTKSLPDNAGPVAANAQVVESRATVETLPKAASTPSTAARVAQLLLAFESSSLSQDPERSVSELARAVGRERSQVSRMLKELADAHLLEQDPLSRRYRLSWRVRSMASGAGDRAIVEVAAPMLQLLVARTREAALFSVQAGNRSLTVMREESQNEIRAGGWVGRRSPMHCTASGRALMFDHDDSAIEALIADDIADTRPELKAPRSVAELIARIRSERRRGYALATDEIELGLTSVGVPVRDAFGRLIGVLNVSGPSYRVTDRVSEFAGLLISASSAVTRALSARPAQRPSK